MIAIVNYGLGNIKAFADVYKKLTIPAVIAESSQDQEQAEKIILPGVGAFDQAMQLLNESGMRDTLDEVVLRKSVPVLGICVGMQILARSSEEGVMAGLGWVDADVIRFNPARCGSAMHVPHMGWNNVDVAADGSLFRDLGDGARFYFLHSYYIHCDSPENVIATATYGCEFACAVRRKNVFGVQFHPEKSHGYGVQLLKNFAEL